MDEREVDLSANQGAPCLHIGRGGQRCERPALEDGFCERHGPDGDERTRLAMKRRLIAVILGLAALWPFLWEFWREISQLTR
jgi:hypothetical protein